VELRIGGDLDVEALAVFPAQEGHQLIRVAEGAEPAAAHAGRHVAAQRDDAMDALADVVLDDAADLGLVGADAGQVRGGLDALGAEPVHGLEGALAGGAAGAVGAGEVCRADRVELGHGAFQLLHALGGLGRKQLEAEGAVVVAGVHDQLP
jgi:hypothetical protein